MGKPTILVVDDDEALYDIITGSLASLDVDLVFANDGESGLQALNNNTPQLILMDLRLPFGVKGWDMIEVIKAEPATTHIPIVAFSASGGEYIRQAMRSGADGFINKPFTIRELQRLVIQFLGAMEQ